MTSIRIREYDVEAAARAQEKLERRYGPARAMEMSAARIRIEADYLARWAGAPDAAHLLAGEAHRLIAAAGAELAVPAPEARRRQVGKSPRLPSAARAAGWAVGMIGVVLLGLGVSGWALG